jgi:5-methylcytosine-specific restriction endonuclease McrA
MTDWLTLHHNEKAVYLYVRRQKGNDVSFSMPDCKTIADRCKIKKREVKKAIRSLEERQLFTQNKDNPDLYTVVPLEEYAPMDICRAIFRLTKLRYADYLKTEHWREVRRRALEYASHSCQLCNSRVRLNVHHRTYKNRGNELPTDVIVLCQACHEKFHDIVNTKEKAVGVSRWARIK